jgi:hypothetical protein
MEVGGGAAGAVEVDVEYGDNRDWSVTKAKFFVRLAHVLEGMPSRRRGWTPVFRQGLPPRKRGTCATQNEVERIPIPFERNTL